MLYFLFIGTSTEGSIYYAPQVNKNSSCVGLFSKKFPYDFRCQLSAWQRQLISILLSLQREVRWAKDPCEVHCFEQRPLQYWCEVCVMDKMYSKVVQGNPSLQSGHNKMLREVLKLRFRRSVLDKNRISNLVFFLNETLFTESRNLELQNNRCGCQENPRAVNEVSLSRPQKHATCMHTITWSVFSKRQIPTFKYI